MGIIAESIAAYAQPLIDQTDGSVDQMTRALSLAQLCWNLALLPEGQRDEFLAEMQGNLKMDRAEFEEFQRSIVLPMIRRHYEMFPNMHRPGSTVPSRGPAAPPAGMTAQPPSAKYPGTARNAPCPCRSGKKYKLCCGR